MPRYLHQRDSYSCGPIAIINAMKAMGYKYTGKDIKRLRRLCETNKVSGTTAPPIFQFLKSQGVDVKLIWNISYKTIKKEAKAGNIIIACGYGFGKGDDLWHWFVIDKWIAGQFGVVNYFENAVYDTIDRKELTKTLNSDGRQPYAAVGIVIRKG